MGKVGGARNFGYGKKMDWAGKKALTDRYGDGNYATRAAHVARWGQFVFYAKGKGIKDARAVTREAIAAYGTYLAGQVASNHMAVAYAQNLLSSVNVVLESMRGDRQLRISPAALVGERRHVRENAPAGLDRGLIGAAVATLQDRDHARVASVVELARDLGLRFREASLLDVREALVQARDEGRINITAGTKGGRGREVDRWVPVSEQALLALERAAALQQACRNLIPPTMNYRQWRDHAYAVWRPISNQYELSGFHDLRAAYACNRYQQLTGCLAPAITGSRQAGRTADHAARRILSQELGHGRADVVATYVGSARDGPSCQSAFRRKRVPFAAGASTTWIPPGVGSCASPTRRAYC